MHRGELIKWQDRRGFGCIRSENKTQEVFLHISELKDSNRRPQIGDTICYDLIVKNGKVCAGNAFIIGATNRSSSSKSLNKQVTSSLVNKHPFPYWETLLLSILPLAGSLHYARITANPLPIILYSVMSLVTFSLYAEDKSRAKRGQWRISEKTLHLCEFAGGWLGGFVAQRKLRHKNIKSSYQIVFWTIAVIHIAFWIYWLSMDN